MHIQKAQQREVIRQEELTAILEDPVLSNQTRVSRNIAREDQAIELLASAALLSPSLPKHVGPRIPGLAAVRSIREFRDLEKLRFFVPMVHVEISQHHDRSTVFRDRSSDAI